MLSGGGKIICAHRLKAQCIQHQSVGGGERFCLREEFGGLAISARTPSAFGKWDQLRNPSAVRGGDYGKSILPLDAAAGNAKRPHKKRGRVKARPPDRHCLYDQKSTVTLANRYRPPQSHVCG